MRAIAVTTIASQESLGIKRLFDLAELAKSQLVIIGDVKTPHWNPQTLPEFVHYFSIEEQAKKWPTLSNLLPINHYARKNLAYLWALENDVSILLDTDDDNYAESDIFENVHQNYRTYIGKNEWVNTYAHFGRPEIWPRGLPLDEAFKPLETPEQTNDNPNWQCFQSIVDGDPDLDAIGRMLNPENHIFEDLEALILGPENFCPTNSQATLWKRPLLPFLYLPITSSFRMTDIWRGIIVSGYQKAYGFPTIFGKLGFIQERNEHNLISDFVDEIPGHLHNRLIKQLSDKLWNSNVSSKDDHLIFLSIYEELVSLEILGESEIASIQEFINVVDTLNVY